MVISEENKGTEKMEGIVIGEKEIGEGKPTFIIAEAGINHGGDLEIAKKLIEAAAKSGADAVKFQTYITEKRVKKESPIFNLLKECELNEKDHEELFSFAEKKNIIFFSTPFDEESVELLVNLGVPLLKIASFDIVNQKLLRKVATQNIPIIISRGMADNNEINRALNIFNQYNATYALLHCVSAYPLGDDDANLNIIKTLKKEYDCPIGYSDHTLGIKVPVLSVAVGATLIEKHFTLDKNLDGPDHKLSANPDEFNEMVTQIREVEKILGSNTIRLIEAEKGALIYRRCTDWGRVNEKITSF